MFSEAVFLMSTLHEVTPDNVKSLLVAKSRNELIQLHAKMLRLTLGWPYELHNTPSLTQINYRKHS